MEALSDIIHQTSTADRFFLAAIILLGMVTLVRAFRFFFSNGRVSKCKSLRGSITDEEESSFQYHSLRGEDTDDIENSDEISSSFDLAHSWSFRFISIAKLCLYIGMLYTLIYTNVSSGKPDGLSLVTNEFVTKLRILILGICGALSGVNTIRKRIRDQQIIIIWLGLETVFSSVCAFRFLRQSDWKSFEYWMIQMSMLLPIMLLSMSWTRTKLWPWEINERRAHYSTLDESNSPKAETLNKAPYNDMNWFMRTTSFWLYPLIHRGYSKELEFEDVPRVTNILRYDEKSKKFEELWNAAKESDKPFSIFSASCKLWTWDFVFLLIPLSIDQIAWMFFPTYLLQHLLRYIENKDQNKEEENTATDIMYVLLFIINKAIWIVNVNFLWLRISMIRNEMRFCWIRCIYKKSLRISQRARLEMSQGKVQNLISTDCNRILYRLEFFFYWGFSIFVRPMIGFTMLFQLVDFTFAYALSFAVILNFALFYFATIARDYQKGINKASDERIKLLTETVKSMIVVKSLGWTRLLVDWIGKKREKEMNIVWKKLKISILVENSINTLRMVGTRVLTIAMYILAGNHLTLEIAFTATSWLDCVREALQILPQYYQELVLMNVSIDRIDQFLSSEETQEIPMLKDAEFDATFDANTELSWFQDLKLASKIASDTEKNCASKLCCVSNSGEVPIDESDVEANSEAREEELERLSLKPNIFITRKPATPWYAGCCCIPDPFAHEEDTVIKREDTLSFVKNKKEVFIESGKLTAVIGEVGAGKSTFITSLTRGDAFIRNGSVSVRNSRGVAYAAQKPCLLTGSVRSNIVFESFYDRKHYIDTLVACDLEDDIALFGDKKDLRRIGEKGLKLSGGQQARVSMARCVYRRDNADMFVFDDTLSALDAHVSQNVFDRVLSSESGLLGSLTRVLVTHDERWLEKADNVIYIAEGSIKYSGTVPGLFDQTDLLEDSLIKEIGKSNWENEDKENVNLPAQCTIDYDSPKWEFTKLQDHDKLEEECEEEENMRGSVSFSVYMNYFNSMGRTIFPLSMVFASLGVFLDFCQRVWITKWVSNTNEKVENSTMKIDQVDLVWMDMNGSDIGHDENYYLKFFSLFVIGAGFCQFINTVLIQYGGYFAALRVHKDVLKAVLFAKMDFFWSTNSGKICNRFSSDLSSMQWDLTNQLSRFTWRIANFFGTILPIIALLPTTLLFIVPFAFFMIAFFHYLRYTERDLERIRKQITSPMYLHFTETLESVNTIRSFRSEAAFLGKCDRLVMSHNRVSLFQHLSFWFMWNMAYIFGSSMESFALYLILHMETEGSLQKGFAAALITYTFELADNIIWSLKGFVDVEVAMIHAERLFQYKEIKPEPSSVYEPKDSWPEQGRVEIRNIKFRYKNSNRDILGDAPKGFSLSIKSGERVGICGRTGAGKSTILKSLLRLRDPSEGSICIDDVDILDITPETMRGRISCVTQENILFSESLRKNLDPFDNCSEEEIWSALKQVGLDEKITNIEGKLNSYVSGADGGNFSVGERQLLSLARALLRKSKLLLLDEATASVDILSDQKVQEVVRALENVTIIAIAHRISTISDYDRVVVLDQGNILEYDSPAKLLQDPNSAFYKLANSKK